MAQGGTRWWHSQLHCSTVKGKHVRKVTVARTHVEKHSKCANDGCFRKEQPPASSCRHVNMCCATFRISHLSADCDHALVVRGRSSRHAPVHGVPKSMPQRYQQGTTAATLRHPTNPLVAVSPCRDHYRQRICQSHSQTVPRKRRRQSHHTAGTPLANVHVHLLCLALRKKGKRWARTHHRYIQYIFLCHCTFRMALAAAFAARALPPPFSFLLLPQPPWQGVQLPLVLACGGVLVLQC